MKILVCNAGSTSLKFKVYAFPEETVLARGRVERVGAEAGSLYFFESADGRRVTDDKARARTYEEGIERFLRDLGGAEDAPRTALLPFAYEPSREDIPTIRVVPSNDVLHYKRLFMSARVNYSKGEDLCLEFGLNGKAFGWASFSTMLGTRQKGTIFEVSDFVMNSGIKHLSKLLIRMLLSVDAQRRITRRFFTDYRGIQTSVYTAKPVSMKYRGVFDLLERDEKAHKLTYVGWFNGRKAEDIYREWWQKEYGS